MGEPDRLPDLPVSLRSALDPDHAVVATAEAAIGAERARISRELHDIVSHSVTVMVLLAAGASRVLDTAPDRTREALVQIERTGTHAMEELGRMLQLLRTGRPADEPGRDEPGRDEPGRAGPGRPGLGEVHDLLAGVRAAGIGVDLQVQGEPRGVSPSISLAAYRVVQEALTNITRYGGPGARATVRIAWSDELLVEVHDDGAGAPAPAELADRLATGHGLAGLTERVTVVGGRLVAGPLPGGGFRVAATLPVCRRDDCFCHPVRPEPGGPA